MQRTLLLALLAALAACDAGPKATSSKPASTPPTAAAADPGPAYAAAASRAAEPVSARAVGV